MKLKLFFSALLFVSVAHAQYPKTVVIDSALDLSDHFGDTVTMYAPGQIVKIGRRMMSAGALESELHAYKLLYSHCDSLRMITDSSKAAINSVVGHLETLNENLNGRLKNYGQMNIHLSEMWRLEKKKSRRQKFIYGSTGLGLGLLGGIITGIIITK